MECMSNVKVNKLNKSIKCKWYQGVDLKVTWNVFSP